MDLGINYNLRLDSVLCQSTYTPDRKNCSRFGSDRVNELKERTLFSKNRTVPQSQVPMDAARDVLSSNQRVVTDFFSV